MRSAETFFVSLGLWTYNIFLGLFLVATRNTSSTAILIAVACALSAEKFKLQVYFSVHLGKETDTTWILAGILVDSRLCLSGLRQKLLLSHQDPGQCPRSVRCRAGEGQALCRREQLYHFPVGPRNERRRRRRRGTTKHLVRECPTRIPWVCRTRAASYRFVNSAFPYPTVISLSIVLSPLLLLHRPPFSFDSWTRSILGPRGWARRDRL